MTLHRRSALLLPALVLVALVLPSSAFGQATRTWVSGVGDDQNPCARTSPCKTFAGAISKTAGGGVINVLDPGAFGAVTITKSLTIRARQYAGVLTGGGNGIVVNAQPADKVTIDGLDIFSGNGAVAGSGVRVLSAGRVNVVNSEISHFAAGVAVVPTSANTKVLVKNSLIYDNGVGVLNAPGNNAITQTTATLRHNTISDNVCGVATGAFGPNGSTPNAATNCGLADFAGINKPATTRIFRNGIEDNQFGVFGRGTNSTSEIARNEIVGNTSFGLRRTLSSVIKSTSPGTNMLSNANDEAANGSITLG